MNRPHPDGGRRPAGARRLAAGLVALAALGSPALAQAPDPSERLAAFDTAWRLVRDTHFDPTFNGVDWNQVRDDLRPRAATASTDDALRGVIRDMLARLGQSHFVLLPASAVDTREDGVVDATGDAGVDVRLLDGRVVVSAVRPNGPAATAGVRPGWSVDGVDGFRIEPLVARLPASLDPRVAGLEVWRAVTRRLRGPPGSALRLALEGGDGALRTVQIRRVPEPGEPITVGSLPTFLVRFSRGWQTTPAGARVGLIRFNVWMARVDAQVGEAIDLFRRADGIVVDLRGNPGGLAAMLMGISGYFLDAPLVLGTMTTRDTDLRFVANPRRVNAAGDRVTPFAGPVAILIDGLTGSASECFAGGMQALGRARVFGERSLGQALPALFDRLPNGDVLIHAYGDFVTANGRRLEGHGVAPDETVPLTRSDLLTGLDRPLAAALAWIDRTRR